MKPVLVKAFHVQMRARGYEAPLYVLETTLGYFEQWLGERGSIASCSVQWQEARKFKTVEQALHESRLLPGCQIVQLREVT